MIINASEKNLVRVVKEATNGGADITIDAIGSEQTTLPALRSLRKGGRHIQVGLTGRQEKGVISLPVDAMVLGEITLKGSFGCSVTSYPGLLALVARGKLQPKRLVTNTVPVEKAGEVLLLMTDFATVGFNIITAW